MRAFFLSRSHSFRNAFSGWWFVIRSQRNAWIHGLATVLVIILGIWLGLSTIEWSIIVLAITLVWLTEFLNTALEATVDLASPQEHRLAKVGKDVSAAAVLISALSSIVIGLLILGPPLLDKLKLLFAQ